MAGVYLIPSGPSNLTQIFPDIDWTQVEEYYVEIFNEDDDSIAFTPTYKMGCCCGEEDNIRISFFNSLGQYDGMSFGKPSILHETVSSSYAKSLGIPLSKRDTGIERFNVRSNDTYEVRNTCYNESQIKWAQEIVDTPKAFLQWTGIEGQDDDYIPIVILDSKLQKSKIVNDFSYEIVLQFKLANDRVIQRN